MILNELHLLMQILSNCFFHRWTVSHQGVLISSNMWNDGTEIQSDKQDRSGKIQEGRIQFKILSVLLRGEMKIYAILLLHIFHGHLKIASILFYQVHKDSQNKPFVKAIMLVSFCSNRRLLESLLCFLLYLFKLLCG